DHLRTNTGQSRRRGLWTNAPTENRSVRHGPRLWLGQLEASPLGQSFQGTNASCGVNARFSSDCDNVGAHGNGTSLTSELLRRRVFQKFPLERAPVNSQEFRRLTDVPRTIG